MYYQHIEQVLLNEKLSIASGPRDETLCVRKNTRSVTVKSVSSTRPRITLLLQRISEGPVIEHIRRDNHIAVQVPPRKAPRDLGNRVRNHSNTWHIQIIILIYLSITQLQKAPSVKATIYPALLQAYYWCGSRSRVAKRRSSFQPPCGFFYYHHAFFREFKD